MMDWEVDTETPYNGVPDAPVTTATAAPAAADDNNPWAVVSEDAPAPPESTLTNTLNTMKSGARKATDKIFGDGAANKLYGGGNEYGVFPSISDTIGDLPSAKEVGGKVLGETEGTAGGIVRGASSVPGMVDATQAEALEGEADRLEHSPWLPKSQRDLAQSYRDHAASLRASSVSSNRDDSSIRNQLKTTGNSLIQTGLKTLEDTQPKDPGVLSKLTLDVAGMAPAAAAAIGSGALAGPGGVIAALGATQYGGSWQELSQHPELSDDDKQKYAAASTALATVLNVAPSLKAFEPAGTAVKRFLGTLGVNVPTQAAQAIGQQMFGENADIRQHLDGTQWAQLAIDSAAQAGILSGAEAIGARLKAGRGGAVDEMMQNSDALKREMFGNRPQPAEPAAPGAPDLQIESETPAPAAAAPKEPATPPSGGAPIRPAEEAPAAPAATATPTDERGQLDAIRQGKAEAGDVLPMVAQGLAKIGADGKPQLLPAGVRRLADLPQPEAPVSGPVVPQAAEKPAEQGTAKAPAEVPPAEAAALKDERRNPESAAAPPTGVERRGKPTTDREGNIIGYRPYVEPFVPKASGPPAPTLPATDEVDLADLKAVHGGDATNGQIGRLIEMGLAKRTSQLSGRLLPAGIRRMKEIETGVAQPEPTPQSDEPVKADIGITPSKKGFTISVDGVDHVTVPTREAAETAVAQLQKDGTHTTQIAGQPVTVNPMPTPAQAAAGNYLKGKVNLHGLQISIENPEGSVRRGVDESGKPWESTLTAHYGYIRGTEDNTGEHVDTFIAKHPKSEKAYVVDQLTPNGRQFDEPKVVLGALTEKEARATYLGNYPKDWKGLGAITKMTIPEFKRWVKSPMAKEPIAWKPQGSTAAAPIRSTMRPQREHDSILEYLSKTTLHGAGSRGLSIDALASEGLDPAELRSARGHGINRPFTKNGGDLDHAAEILGEAGYPTLDDQGRPDKNKTLDLITAEIRNGQRTLGAGAHHESDIERLRAKYEIPEDVTRSPVEELDRHLEALHEHLRLSDEEHARNMTADIAERTGKYSQGQLFDDATVKNEIKRLEAEKDRRRNTGQQSLETGRPDDLFSQARHQVDLTDKPTRSKEDQIQDAKHLLVTAYKRLSAANGALYERNVQGAERQTQEKIAADAEKAIAALEPKWKALTGEAFGMLGHSVAEPTAAYGEPYYSQVLRTVEGAKLEKGTPEQWAGYLKNQPGVKAEEMQWIGLDDWLKEQSGPVTRQQVEDFVRANQIEILHDWNGAHPPPSAATLAGRKAIWEKYAPLFTTPGEVMTDYRKTQDERDAALRKFNELIEQREAEAEAAHPLELSKDAEFEQYTLGGGQNYRELLLKLPEKNDNLPPKPEPLTELPAGYETIIDRHAHDLKQWGVTRPGQASAMMMGGGWPDEAAAIRDAIAILNNERYADWKQELRNAKQANNNYYSPHWSGQANVLAHVRFDERTDAEGKRALHMAELQSDWHQKGRKVGYIDAVEKVAALEKKAAQLMELGKEATPEQKVEWANTRNEIQKLRNAVPDAPFKTTWPELAMKRMIRYAAENGFDRLTWDTGETNAARYSLSKKIGAIRLYDNSSGGIGKPRMEGEFTNGMLYAYDAHDRQNAVIEKYINSPDELADTIGKEVAEKLMNHPGEAGSHAGIGMRVRELKGLELEVGGEGMKGFYDRMLPSIANKLGKKFGGKVSRSTVPTGDPENVTGWESTGNVASSEPVAVHSLDITPQMREAAMQGMSVFEAQRAYRSQMMLPFGPPIAKKLAELPTRPNTTPAQSAVGAAALRALLYIKDRSGASVLGTDIVTDFVDRGKTKLIGAAPKTPADLARLAQVYRNPQFETFRVLYTKGDEIVHQTGISSRLPGAVGWTNEQARDIVEQYKRSGADGYWLLHNHPSGAPMPSNADIFSTEAFAKAMPGFKAHVVIDNDAYGLITLRENGNADPVQVYKRKFGGYHVGTVREPHALIGKNIMSPQRLAESAKQLERVPGQTILIATRGAGTVGTILSVPASFFQGSRLRVGAKLRRIQRVAGASRMFAVAAHTADLQPFLDNGILVDAVSPTGQSMYHPMSSPGAPTGMRDRRAQFGGREKIPSYLVEEPNKGIYKPGSVARSIVATIPQSEFVQAFRRIVNPVGMSDESMNAARLVRAKLGEQAFNIAQSQQKLEKFSRAIENLPPQARLDMIDDIERGLPQRMPAFQPAADAMRAALDDWRKKIQSLGMGHLENFIENYFPHIWQDENAVKKVMGNLGRRPLKGSASFLKQRTIPYTKDGIDLGLKPVSTNPLVLTFLKLREMQRFYTGVRIMEQLKAEGMAKFLPANKMVPEGWAEIKDAVGRVLQWSDEEGGFIIRGKYIMPEDAARVLNNHLSGSKLANFAPAQAIRVLSNSLNALQLGFSAFHLGFTTLDAMISKFAVGVERVMHGEPLQAAKTMLELPISPMTNLYRGHQLRKAYLNIGGATPELQRMVGALTMAGGRIRMPKYFLPANNGSPFHGAGVASLAHDVRQALTAPAGKIPHEIAKSLASNAHDFGMSVFRELQDMGHTLPIWQIPLEVAGRLTRASTSVIMEQLVPLQKLGVFYDLAADAMRRKPDMPADQMARVMQSIWDSVDNRLGEMVYDNRFWDRTFKDSMHMSIRAVGWNYGTVAEIGGAGTDAMKLLGKVASGDKVVADDIGHKIPYVIGMTCLTMLIGAMFTRLLTGKGPQDIKDYFFPRTGGTTKQGTPERISLPSYAKDVYEYSQHPTQTVINKANPIYSLIHDVWSNSDYFGDAIYNPDASVLKKGEQIGKYVFKEAAPFSIQGAKQISGSTEPGLGGTVRKVMPFVGLTPAPAYITSPEQMERREHSEKTKAYVKSLNWQIKQAREKGDMAAIRDLTKERDEVKNGTHQESINLKADKRLRDIEHKKKEAQAKDKLTSRIAPLIEGKTRADAIEALHEAGMPAMADLLASLPKTARPAMQAFYQSEAGGGQS